MQVFRGRFAFLTLASVRLGQRVAVSVAPCGYMHDIDPRPPSLVHNPSATFNPAQAGLDRALTVRRAVGRLG